MTHRSWRWVAAFASLAALALAVRADVPVVAQGSPIEIIFDSPAARAGDSFGMFLVVDAPPTGEVKAYLDGLGVLWDSFVLRFMQQHPGQCLPPSRRSAGAARRGAGASSGRWPRIPPRRPAATSCH